MNQIAWVIISVLKLYYLYSIITLLKLCIYFVMESNLIGARAAVTVPSEGLSPDTPIVRGFVDLSLIFQCNF